MDIRVKRIYEDPSTEDGVRILVDRLWPRGLSKQNARVDIWFKEIAPSTELRKWFDHDAEKWEGFKRCYWDELTQNPDAWALLISTIGEGPVTLLFAAKQEQYNDAVALKEFIDNRFKYISSPG